MGRPLRIEYPGALYHVTSRGNERGAVFMGCLVFRLDRITANELCKQAGLKPIF